MLREAQTLPYQPERGKREMGGAKPVYGMGRGKIKVVRLPGCACRMVVIPAQAGIQGGYRGVESVPALTVTATI